MKKIIIALAVVIVAVIVFTSGEDSVSNPDSGDSVQREADDSSIRIAPAGTFVGFADEHNSHSWLGIPFAKAPVGPLRWRAPQALAPLTEQLQATAYQQPCVQFQNVISGVVAEDGELVGSEDCLYLNVWAPKFSADQVPGDKEKLPVMVWIHGGGNTVGTPNTYNGAKLASEQNVIYVGISYRLGILGWLSHDAIRQTAVDALDASGNFGTLDIISSLQWVQENIAAFGGDPDNVTLFGESAGGRNVFAMVASPLARGLFHKAISQSGSLLTESLSRAENWTDDEQPGFKHSSNELISAVLVETDRADDRDEAKALMAQMGTGETMGFLRDRSVGELFSVIPTPAGIGAYASPQNIRDGFVLPSQSTYQLIKNAGPYNKVPMILGTNRDEAKLFMMLDPNYTSMLLGIIPRIKDEVVYNHRSSYLSDQWKALSVDEPALLLSEQTDVFAYRFDWDEGPDNFVVEMSTLIGAAHGVEIPFVFGNFERGGDGLGSLNTDDNEAGRVALSNAMMSYWAQFARSGNPNVDGSNAPQWNAWDNTGNKLLVLDTEADGGVRMTDTLLTVQSIKQRMAGDALISNQQEYCQWYAELFLDTYQVSDFWDPQEYQNLGASGCAQYPPYEFSVN